MRPISQSFRCLDAVARRGSVRKAAEVLHLTAAAVHQQILNCEEQVGTPLFDRLPRGMKTVSPRSHSQPMKGHSRTSALQTKAAGEAALMAKMSSQETWFATSRAGIGAMAGACRRTPSMPSSWRDQRCFNESLSGRPARGYTTAATASP